ncbi:hypothetical protein, conserved [Plasmodium gonderi]|uniref:ABC1 atypical kinase-like domain-containing protein n=1 Tax=Plasmodium gonderi TaxID=77519 RepID=A0A1Y1JLQ4_PLAGO|nr:hypothetical protein, conserved [Plasmodium gonderi]GAW83496.1 hypothetical protein, conserved [Plasmodium gonderi]
MKLKKHLFVPVLCRRYYMSNGEISKFKDKKNKSEDVKEGLKPPNKEANSFGRKYRSGDLATPYEIYKWSNILNTINEKLIDDVIKQEEKKKKKKKTITKIYNRNRITSSSRNDHSSSYCSDRNLICPLDLHRIVQRYYIMINDKENDIYVENEINNHFSNLINTLEYHFDVNKVAMEFLKSIKKNESHIFYYLYNNFKFLHIFPYKYFWTYEYAENNFCDDDMQNKEEYDNEYLFKNIDLNKLDLLLRDEEDILSAPQEKTRNECKNKYNDVQRNCLNVQEMEHNHKLKFINRKKSELCKKENYDHVDETLISHVKLKGENNFITFDKIEKDNSIKHNTITKDRGRHSNYEFLTTPFQSKNKNNTPIINSKRFLCNIGSSSDAIAVQEMKLKNVNCIDKPYGISNMSNCENNKMNNVDSFTKSENLMGSNDNTNKCNEKLSQNSKEVNVEDGKRNNLKNMNYENMVDEHDFNYDINILNKKITTGVEKSERTNFRTSNVPVSPLSRATVFGKVLFDIAKNSSVEYIKSRLTNGFANRDDKSVRNSDNLRDVIINEKNAEILANGLSKMRGVVLKLGQMISLQDEHLSPILVKAFKLVSNSADVMPKGQLISVLKKEMGSDYEKKFDSFNYTPFASASIGQVHKAIINNKKVAVKIQYPGVYESIDSDIKNLLFINQYTNLILKNLYIENLCREIKKELKCECDYINEAKYYALFKNIFQHSKYFYVPTVYSEYVTKHILVTSYVEGITLDEVAQRCPQAIRDSIGQRILYLCLHELFVFKIMNTDPNLGNFLYNVENDKLCLIDFGATRFYKNEFVDNYLRLVKASLEEDKSKIYHYSYELNFLTGKENEEMKNSHIKSVILVGEPFKSSTYNFTNNDIAKQIYKLLPKIIYNRLVPPRSEIYTLHRKLSGAYLICMKLKARVKAAHIFNSIYENYKFTSIDTYCGSKLRT